MKNPYYDFILNMWIMGRIDEAYLDKAIKAGRINEDEKEMIMLTPQM